MINHADYIKKSLGLKQKKSKTSYKKLLSIHLQSNNPVNFSGFIESLEKHVENIDLIEVIVKIDDKDDQMNSLLEDLVKNSKVSIKYISTPLLGNFSDLWRSMNDILLICEKETYFIWNMNDEMRVPIYGWDKILKEYVDIFPDGLFRLRTSRFRHRNYTDPWECCFAPETSAITTKKLIDTCGDWNPTLGPDTFNQLVAYYFSYHDRFNMNKETRDIVLTAGSWYKLVSYKTQLEASRRSQLIQAQIYKEGKFSKSKEYNDIQIIQKNKNIIIVLNKVELYKFPYKISRLKITLSNFLKSLQYFKYGGGGNNYIQNNTKNGKYKSKYRIIINEVELLYYSICLRLKLRKLYAIGRLYKLFTTNLRRKYLRKFKKFRVLIKKIKEILNKIIAIPIYFIKYLLGVFFYLMEKLVIFISFFKLLFKYFKRIIFEEIRIFKGNTFLNYLLKNKRNYSYSFICRYHLLHKHKENTDATYFFNRINYSQLILFLECNNTLLVGNNLKDYIEIIMLCRFYKINLHTIQENKEIISSQLFNVEYIFNNFNTHYHNILQIDDILKTKLNYNLRSFLY